MLTAVNSDDSDLRKYGPAYHWLKLCDSDLFTYGHARLKLCDNDLHVRMDIPG